MANVVQVPQVQVQQHNPLLGSLLPTVVSHLLSRSDQGKSERDRQLEAEQEKSALEGILNKGRPETVPAPEISYEEAQPSVLDSMLNANREPLNAGMEEPARAMTNVTEQIPNPEPRREVPKAPVGTYKPLIQGLLAQEFGTKPEKLRMVKNAQGEYQFIPEKLGGSGVTGYQAPTTYADFKAGKIAEGVTDPGEIAKQWKLLGKSAYRPTSIPGIMANTMTGKFVDAEGNTLTYQEVRNSGLTYKEMTPTDTTKTMQQKAPKVLMTIADIRQLMDAPDMGPVKGRWNAFWTTNVGANNPEFTALQTRTKLLNTLLMQMHVGARGSNFILKEFQDMINAGKQTPENFEAALNQIEMYAQEVNKSTITTSQERVKAAGLEAGSEKNKKQEGPIDLKNMSTEELLKRL